MFENTGLDARDFIRVLAHDILVSRMTSNEHLDWEIEEESSQRDAARKFVKECFDLSEQFYEEYISRYGNEIEKSS